MFQLTEDGKRAFAKFLDGWEDLYAKGQFINGGVVTSFDQIPDALPFIKDLNRMQTDYFNPSMQYLGRTNPLFVGGFNTFFKYKNLEFTTQWTFKTGHIIESFSDLKNAPGKKSYKVLRMTLLSQEPTGNANIWNSGKELVTGQTYHVL